MALGLCGEQPATDPGAHLREVSGMGALPEFQVWAPRPLTHGVQAHPGALCLCAQSAGVFIRVRSHLGFQVWAPSPLIGVHASWASGKRWGCISPVHIPGAEWGGAPEAAAAAESSLTSH